MQILHLFPISNMPNWIKEIYTTVFYGKHISSISIDMHIYCCYYNYYHYFTTVTSAPTSTAITSVAATITTALQIRIGIRI